MEPIRHLNKAAFLNAYLLFFFGITMLTASFSQGGETVVISSLAELAEYGAKNGNHVRLEPGVYRLKDYLTEKRIQERRNAEDYYFIRFSGSDV